MGNTFVKTEPPKHVATLKQEIEKRGWPTALSSRGIQIDHIREANYNSGRGGTIGDVGFGDVQVMYHVDISSPPTEDATSVTEGIRDGVLEITIDTDVIVPAQEEMMMVVDTVMRVGGEEDRNFSVILECSKEDSTSVNSFITESTNTFEDGDSDTAVSTGMTATATIQKRVLFIFQKRKKCTVAEISPEGTHTIQFFWAHQIHVKDIGEGEEEEGGSNKRLLETNQPVLLIQKEKEGGDVEGENLGYAELIFLGKPGIERLKYSTIKVMERNK